ncbi:MAG TPA: hypothetical protein VIL56_10695 [Gaiellaceae bacterium]
MKRVLLLLAAAVALGVAAGLLLQSRNDQSLRPSRGRTMSISTSVEPRVQMFGDPVTARIDLLFDRRRVLPAADKIRIDAPFSPYEIVGGPKLERAESGELVHLRYTYRLLCLDRRCTTGGPRTDVQLPPLRVFYSLADIRQRVNDSAEWPTVSVASQLTRADLRQARWRANRDLPAVSYAIAPGALGALLAAASLLALLGSAAVGAPLFARERAAPEDRDAVAKDRLSPLDRALATVRRVFDTGEVPDRRRALERLSRELGRAGEPELAARARGLAWSPDAPSLGEVDALAADVRAANGGGPA